VSQTPGAGTDACIGAASIRWRFRFGLEARPGSVQGVRRAGFRSYGDGGGRTAFGTLMEVGRQQGRAARASSAAEKPARDNITCREEAKLAPSPAPELLGMERMRETARIEPVECIIVGGQ